MYLNILKHFNITIFICFWLVLPSCKTSQKYISKKNKNIDAFAVQEILIKNQVNADWLHAKAQLKLNTRQRSNTLNLNIRMRKDSIIWFSAKYLGIEGVRALITNDSIHIINRIQRVYQKGSFDDLIREFSFPITFEIIQALVLGNPVFFTTTHTLDNSGEEFHLKGVSSKFESNYTLEAATLNFTKFLFTDLKKGFSLSGSLNNYDIVDDYRISLSRKYTISNNSNQNFIEMILHLQKYKFDHEVLFPFRVPGNYNVEELNF